MTHNHHIKELLSLKQTISTKAVFAQIEGLVRHFPDWSLRSMPAQCPSAPQPPSRSMADFQDDLDDILSVDLDSSGFGSTPALPSGAGGAPVSFEVPDPDEALEEEEEDDEYEEAD